LGITVDQNGPKYKQKPPEIYTCTPSPTIPWSVKMANQLQTSAVECTRVYPKAFGLNR